MVDLDAKAEDTPRSRVTKISIGRLKNLGNYEHVRYEVTVEIAQGDSAANALRHVEGALEAIAEKSPSEWSVRNAQTCIRKFHEDHVGTQEDLDRAKEIVSQHSKYEERQKRARDSLDAIGLSNEFTDHKLNWDQDDH